MTEALTIVRTSLHKDAFLCIPILLTDIVLEAVIALAIISVLLAGMVFVVAGGWAYCVSQINNIDYATIDT